MTEQTTMTASEAIAQVHLMARWLDQHPEPLYDAEATDVIIVHPPTMARLLRILMPPPGQERGQA